MAADIKDNSSVSTTPLAQGIKETSTVPSYVVDARFLDQDKLRDISKHMMKSGSTADLYQKAENDPAIKKSIDAIGAEVRKMLTEQKMPIDKNITDAQLARYAIESFYRGPNATHNNGMCVVSDPGYDAKKSLAAIMPVDFPMKELPGDPKNYERLKGRHEGGHCADINGSGVQITAALATMKGEVIGDKSSFPVDGKPDGLEVERNARMDLRVLAFIHTRAGTDHATSFFIDDKGNAVEPTEKSVQNLRNLKENMIASVSIAYYINTDRQISKKW